MGIGPREFIVWIISLILVAGFMPTYLGQLGATLPEFSADSPERFLWSITPFVIVAALVGSLLSAAMSSNRPPEMGGY